MSLYLDGEIDCVAASGKRELNRIPPHFSIVGIDQTWVDSSRLRNWCWTNLSGRFAVGEQYKKISSDSNKLNHRLVIGFEDQSEAVMFTLMLPNIIGETDFDLL